jgi:hypothetical protein
LATGYAQFAVATFNPSYVVYFILSSDHITIIIMLHKEFQMEPSDSELFASGLYTAMFIQSLFWAHIYVFFLMPSASNLDSAKAGRSWWFRASLGIQVSQA